MDAQSGAITANGISLTNLPIEAWREYVALVPQRPYLFYGSVFANICLARPGASEDEVVRAAEFAGAAAFINRLPHGYATEIGERGMRLSAGEAQRIAIARAFLKDAPLLILDEPTSSLDPESEMLIRQALERLVHDRTVLVIAHRRNTIASCSAGCRPGEWPARRGWRLRGFGATWHPIRWPCQCLPGRLRGGSCPGDR